MQCDGGSLHAHITVPRVCVQAKGSQHVLALPMQHAGDQRHYSYLCDCPDMQPGIQTLDGLDSRRNPKLSKCPRQLVQIAICPVFLLTFAFLPGQILNYSLCTAWDLAARRCLHSKAVEVLHAIHASGNIDDLPEEAIYRAVNLNVVLDSFDTVSIVNPESGPNFLLSVALTEANLPRAFVGAPSNKQLRCFQCKSITCAHCDHVRSWVEERDGEDADLGEIFEGLNLLAESVASEQAAHATHLPISKTRLPPDFSFMQLAARAMGASKWLSSRMSQPY